MIHCTLLNRAISSGVENRESTYSFSGMKPWRFDAIRRGFKQIKVWGARAPPSRKTIGKNHEKIRGKKALSHHVKLPPTRVKATSIITGRISEKAIDKFRIIKTWEVQALRTTLATHSNCRKGATARGRDAVEVDKRHGHHGGVANFKAQTGHKSHENDKQRLDQDHHCDLSFTFPAWPL